MLSATKQKQGDSVNKMAFIVAGISLILTACAGSSVIPKQKYVDAMVALGCKNLQEGNPAADEVLKQNGVTSEQIRQFRQKSDFKIIADAAGEIATRVGACFGVSQ